jgi:hypothetical protein
MNSPDSIDDIRKMAVDYDSIRSLDEFKEAVEEANVVLGFDKLTDNMSIIYGTAMVAAIAQETVPTQPLKVVAFKLDFSPEAEQIEHLCAAVKTLFGFHEYEAESE